MPAKGVPKDSSRIATIPRHHTTMLHRAEAGTWEENNAYRTVPNAPNADDTGTSIPFTQQIIRMAKINALLQINQNGACSDAPEAQSRLHSPGCENDPDWPFLSLPALPRQEGATNFFFAYPWSRMPINIDCPMGSPNCLVDKPLGKFGRNLTWTVLTMCPRGMLGEARLQLGEAPK